MEYFICLTVFFCTTFFSYPVILPSVSLIGLVVSFSIVPNSDEDSTSPILGGTSLIILGETISASCAIKPICSHALSPYCLTSSFLLKFFTLNALISSH